MKTIVRTAPNGDVTTVIDMGDDVPDPVEVRQTIFRDKRDDEGKITQPVPEPDTFVGKRFSHAMKQTSAQPPLPADLLLEIEQRTEADAVEKLKEKTGGK